MFSVTILKLAKIFRVRISITDKTNCKFRIWDKVSFHCPKRKADFQLSDILFFYQDIMFLWSAPQFLDFSKGQVIPR